MEEDSFQLNIQGVQDLVGSDVNKVGMPSTEEVGEIMDVLKLDMDDEDLLKLRDEYERKHAGYYPKIETRAKNNKNYYAGKEYRMGSGGASSNLIFEAEETFLPKALAKNPEPVVWSDNTPEGEQASSQIKAILQYKSDTMVLRKKLGIVLRHWSIYFTGIVKYGWDKKSKDFTLQVRNPKNFVWDSDAYIDESGRYIGDFIGERCTVAAQKLIDKFPSSKDYIYLKVDGKLGTKCTYTEWWTDEYCFYTFEDEVLDKHKNQFFNYPKTEKNTPEEQEKYGLDEEETVTPGKNHFAQPVMPYTFFSVFTLQEQPHDITNLIEQSIPNQDRILDRDLQISRNLRTGNNSLIMDDRFFTIETAKQGAMAIEDGDPILGNVEGVKRLPASPLPSGILEAQETDKQTLRAIFGTSGITPQEQSSTSTARGMILNQDQDSSRIGGGIGESLEQFADANFNWMLQLMYVFYDEPHYAAIVGQGNAISYVGIVNSDINRQFVVSVSPNSMAPKDEVSVQNQAVSLFTGHSLDPLSLFQKLDFPDPKETALKTAIWITNPQQYIAQFLGDGQQQQGQPAQTGQLPPQEGTPQPDLTAPLTNEPLQQVPLNTQPT